MVVWRKKFLFGGAQQTSEFFSDILHVLFIYLFILTYIVACFIPSVPYNTYYSYYFVKNVMSYLLKRFGQ